MAGDGEDGEDGISDAGVPSSALAATVCPLQLQRQRGIGMEEEKEDVKFVVSIDLHWN